MEGTTVFESHMMRDEIVCNIEHDAPLGHILYSCPRKHTLTHALSLSLCILIK